MVEFWSILRSTVVSRLKWDGIWGEDIDGHTEILVQSFAARSFILVPTLSIPQYFKGLIWDIPLCRVDMLVSCLQSPFD